MKVKKYLSVLAVVCAGALTLAGCSDYDNGYNENAIKFQEEFRKAYGDIDPEQDWNLAERVTITVNTQTESRIKIYARMGEDYAIVGDYEGVSGTRMLGVDIAEGTRDFIVSDGMTAQSCAPGDVVVFNSMSTRSAHPTTDPDAWVKVIPLDDDKVDSNGEIEINGVNYPQYKEATKAHYDNMQSSIPEIDRDPDNYRIHTNLPKVMNNFSFQSTGSFIVYPYYWVTSSVNEIGLYYFTSTDRSKDNMVYVPIYTNKSGNEFQYLSTTAGTPQVANLSSGNITTTDNAVYWSGFKSFVWTDGTYNLVKNIEGMPKGNLLDNFTDIHLKGTFKGKTPGMRIVFYDNNGSPKSYEVTNPKLNPQVGEENTFEATINLQSLVNSDATWESFLKNCSEVCLAGSQNLSKGPWAINIGGFNGNVYGDVTLDYVRFEKNAATWVSYTGDNCYEILGNNIGSKVRGKGIKVEIPKDEEFGMYLKKYTDNDPTKKEYIFYSQSEYNDPEVVGAGVDENGNSHIIDNNSKNPCYASKFNVESDSRMFLGFEDWPNFGGDANGSDFDLNDVVLAFDGCKPKVFNEDPTESCSWLIACEDLGGSFDVDYNDVVFKVEHVSGKEHAEVTALAAGGTLASYICYLDPTRSGNDKCLGEIHEMFNNVGRAETSGEYTPLNVGSVQGYTVNANRYDYTASPISIKVDKDWTMAFYSTDTWRNEGNDYGVNMGGFEIRTLKAGTPIPTGEVTIDSDVFDKMDNSERVSRIQPPGDKGEAPYILCLPLYYEVMNTPDPGTKTKYIWAWPSEFVTISTTEGGGPYPEFKDWVSDKSNNTWYMHKYNEMTVKDESWPSAMSQEEIAANPSGDDNQGGDDENTKQNPDFRSYGQSIVKGSYCEVWNGSENSHTINLGKEEQLKIVQLSVKEGATGDYSLTLDAGNTGTTFTRNNNEFFITTGNTSGTVTATLHYSGDSNFNSADVVITINVVDREYKKLVATNKDNKVLAHAWGDPEKAVLQDASNYNNAEVWALEWIDEVSFRLYNVGVGKYITCNHNNSMVISYVTTPPTYSDGYFHFEDNKIACNSKTETRWMGYKEENGTLVVSGNGGDGKYTIITWDLSSAAKRRQVKANK